MRLSHLLILAFCLSAPTLAGDGNRLAYLDENNPYYVHRDFPKLTTPMWVGEEGVEAVVILSIDDMRDPARYETYLRPILNRLKEIDGRAPVSIMTCSVKPDDPQLTQWLDEGLSLETHTVDHPCPLLQGADFDNAKSTYDRCIDLLHEVPGNKPVAFRMPCCDSLNTVSPRFYAEIFNKTTPKGNFLSIDSSVFNVFTSDDPDIPRNLVLDAEGNERFRQYIPKGLVRQGKTFDTFVNYVENYPYPYVINRLCWQFPCVTPSDWSAQHRQGVNNPKTVEDWKAALDITVNKQGVFPLVFHPHGWIKSEQIIELIDHAAEKHGRKVKFLTFREAAERLNTNLLGGHPLRDVSGHDNGIRVLDLDNDGFVDVIAANSEIRETRRWSGEHRDWKTLGFKPGRLSRRPTRPDGLPALHANPPFGILEPSGRASFIALTTVVSGTWHFTPDGWQQAKAVADQEEGMAWYAHDEFGTRARDLNGDGRCELLHTDRHRQVTTGMRWVSDRQRWIYSVVPIRLPPGVHLTDKNGRDAGLRLIDLNGNGELDVVFSNHERYGIWLNDTGLSWRTEVMFGRRGEKDPNDELPPIVREDGSDNGFFVHSRHLFWQNEDTADLPDLVDRRSFDDLLKDVTPGPKSPEMSLRSIVPRPGFTVELMAAEPLVIDPVAFEWGADGRLWVVEMGDYPSGMSKGSGVSKFNFADESVSDRRHSRLVATSASERTESAKLNFETPDPGLLRGGGRIRILEDTTGDGRYDKATLFLDGLNFPKGLLPWKKGVLITAAPDILYAEDTTGDGRADQVEVLFTGFGEGNQQHRVNGLVWGLDNWIHCANGDSGGQIKSIKTGEVVDIRGRDFRIRPHTGQLELESGQTQFGRNRDDWGNWFGGNNSNPMWHYALADRYLRRNPHLAAPDPRVHVSVTPGAAPCYPVSRPMARFNDFDKLNRFTSACSPVVYRDELFGPEFAGHVFVSEPAHNLVHRQVMQPNGVTFTSRRADDEQESEFLASRDNWFRPTMIKTGPDGALWIADMYRLVIEHPQYIPKELQEGWDLRAGDNRGRLYRVYPKGATPRPMPQLDRLTTEELVAALDCPNGWQRDTAQALLVERGEEGAVALLEAEVRGQRSEVRSQESGGRSQESEGREPGRVASMDSQALSRLHALCTLDGLKALKPEIVRAALGDPHPGVRRHVVRLAEGMLQADPNPTPASDNSPPLQGGE